MLKEVDYWLWFSLKYGISPARRIELIQQFGSPETLYGMDKKAMKKTKLSLKEKRLFLDKDMEEAEAVKERCKEVGIHILTYHNPAYPEKLKEIPDAPCLLYVRCKHRINLNDRICISMVGNRIMTSYGETVANEMGAGFAKAGVVVVSGMANGIDAASHIGALQGGGLTVAVLGCGADIAYPKHHEMLMRAIIENGMVITEYPPGTAPLPRHFPARNRIISGLSEGTVVVEAPIKSGSLITAGLALKQNRDVFAVPGDVNRRRSQGCNKLISKGAILVNSAEDVLKEYELVFRNILKQYYKESPKEIKAPQKEISTVTTFKREPISVKSKKTEGLVGVQKCIAEHLSISPISLEELTRKTGLSADELSTELVMMQLSGIISELPGKHYVLKV